jgi:hypothetical protein
VRNTDTVCEEQLVKSGNGMSTHRLCFRLAGVDVLIQTVDSVRQRNDVHEPLAEAGGFCNFTCPDLLQQFVASSEFGHADVPAEFGDPSQICHSAQHSKFGALSASKHCQQLTEEWKHFVLEHQVSRTLRLLEGVA